MALRDSIQALVSAASPDTLVPVRWLAQLLAADSDTSLPAPETGVDLTVAQLAARFGKSTSTIRTWLERGDFPGAYRLHGREWRVPATSIASMQQQQAEAHKTPRTRASSARRTTDISEWRHHMPKAS